MSDTARTGFSVDTAQRTLVAALGEIVGARHVLTGDAETRRYRTGYRFGTGRVRAVARPGTLVEQWKVLAACVAARVIVITQASNTGLNGGSTPDGDDYDRDVVIVSTTRIRRVHLLREARQVVCIGGTTLDQLERTLKPLGREPHSVIGSSCIGASVLGGISNNSGGSLVHRGPAYTEMALYAAVDASGTLRLVNHLGTTPEDILSRIESGTFTDADVHDGAAASDHDYATHVRGVDAATPARFNGGPAASVRGIWFGGQDDDLRCAPRHLRGGTGHEGVLHRHERCRRAHRHSPSCARELHASADRGRIHASRCIRCREALRQGPVRHHRSLRHGPAAALLQLEDARRCLVRTPRLHAEASAGPPAAMVQRTPARASARAAHAVSRPLRTSSDVEGEGGGRGGSARVSREAFRAGRRRVFRMRQEEGRKVFLHRFAAASAAVRYRTVHHREVEDIVALDIALRRNDRDWFERLPQHIEAPIVLKLYYGHFLCHVFHQDYIVVKGHDCMALEHEMLELLDARGAEYPVEHNVGHLYEAKPQLADFYRKLDPCNCFNPGIGKTSKFAAYRDAAV